MIKNIGNTDRLVRFTLGPILIVVAFVLGITSVFGIVAAVLGVLLVATAAVRTCPAYLPFGIRTTPRS
ncbi:DUF2892 domain-containing protein [Raineyella sp. LH-20]|uniref:YgaP family membrane protein n=1 Tax=Raineyella sp. LH-20 TaxID=3081204 RepID=UPI002953B059|nr:DUF2892 domain-containing protein [Raineyella sp. LH-20]WOP18044.1 DUF2892 domain-containing protein [Raineyella sp. LH-20]